MTIQPGDILFYKGKPGDIYDIAITAITHSPIVHTAVALSSIQKLEALSSGIMLNPINNRDIAARWSLIESGLPYDETMLHNALNWALSQKGNAYGTGDAINALIQYMGIGLSINVNNLLDCSAFCSEVLIKTLGGIPYHPEIIDPHRITPALLIEYLKVKIE